MALPCITPADCLKIVSDVLPAGQDSVLVHHRQRAFDQINGYLGDHSSLVIEVEVAGGTRRSFHFFVKALPRVKSQRDFLLDFNGFFKERRFFTAYQTLLQEAGIDLLQGAVPVCRFVSDELFVFDDLSRLGYVTLPSRAPLDVVCVERALVTLAKLHASGLVLEEMRQCRLTDHLEAELRESFYLGTASTERAMRSCKSGLRALIELTHTEEMRMPKEAFQQRALEGCDMLKVFTRPSTEFRNTVCHADLWTKNFMFRFEAERPVDCVLVDFQTYRYGPPAQDVLTFLYLVSDRRMRQQHLGRLLRFYYTELNAIFRRFGVGAVVTEEEFFRSCDHFRRFAITQNLLHFQVVIMSDEVAAELFADPDNTMRVLFEDKYEFFKDTCARDSVYRERNFELIGELREFYEEQLGEVRDGGYTTNNTHCVDQ